MLGRPLLLAGDELHLRGNDLGRGWLALRAALLWASDAQEDLRDVECKSNAVSRSNRGRGVYSTSRRSS
jgi:hypothetical protein